MKKQYLYDLTEELKSLEEKLEKVDNEYINIYYSEDVLKVSNLQPELCETLKNVISEWYCNKKIFIKNQLGQRISELKKELKIED